MMNHLREGFNKKNELKFLLPFVFVLSQPLPSAYAQGSDSRVVDYPSAGVVIGNGWSSLDAAKTSGACIDFEKVDDLSEDRSSNITRIFDKEQLNRALDISVELQAKSIAGFSASAKTTFSSSIELKNEALNLLVWARVRQGSSFVSAKVGKPYLGLTDFALNLLKTDEKQFFVVCGDSYVESIHSGGEINAVLSFEINSADERESVATTVTAGGFGFTASTTVSQSLKQYSEASKLYDGVRGRLRNSNPSE